MNPAVSLERVDVALMSNARAPFGAWLRSGLALLAAAPALVGLAAVLFSWHDPQSELLEHLARHLLGDAVLLSAGLALTVALAAIVVGGGFALLVGLCDFRGRRVLEVLLVLPLAVPAYVLAFTWISVLDVGGPLRGWLIAEFGHARWLPSLRNPGGAWLLMSAALYPYVYLLTRAALDARGRALFEAARTLGRTPWSAAIHAVLPVLWPSLIAGATLVALEVLAEFGAMAILGVDTLSTVVYRTWFGLGSLAAAAQVASILLLLALLVLLGERWAKGRAPHATDVRSHGPALKLDALGTGVAWLLALLWLTPALLLPLAVLGWWSFDLDIGWRRLLDPAWQTLRFAGGAASLIVLAGMLFALAPRAGHAARALPWLRRVAGLGYAMPGVVLAAGLMLCLIAVERLLGLPGVLASSALAVWLGLLARFMRVGTTGAARAVALVPASLDAVARTLGATRWRRLVAVRLPLLWPGLAATWLLAFVECAKELPATLMLRPFGADTLAVKVYNATSEGLWQAAAPPALAIVLVALLPAWWLLRDRRTALAVTAGAQ